MRWTPAVLIPLIGCAATPAGHSPFNDPDRCHDRIVTVRGIVASVCEEEGCFIDIVPPSGKGEGILVNARRGGFRFPTDCVGKVAVVTGTFYRKVYPAYRMEHWHDHGWRAREERIPSFACISRITADSVDLRDLSGEGPVIAESPLSPYLSGVVDLDCMEFEANRMGTGKKRLEPGGRTPEHSSGRHQEIIICLEGEVTVLRGEDPEEVRITPSQVCYIPPGTRHAVENRTDDPAVYVFVFSLPGDDSIHDH
jgi:quercetin dioxygenase-like cupin family protein